MAPGGDRVPGETPRHLGRYRIVERIGKGSMGIVYAADDDAMGRRVAVKVMMADLEEEPDTRERFYREARVTGQLMHRNIVTVFDLGDDHGRPYIVMELLHGLPLVDHLQRPEAQALEAKLDLMMQVCEGLQVAHDRGVIHRDIKPSNLFVQTDGSLKILDFGVARLATSTLTAGGALVGTPEYMSPEQAMGRAVDARSDVFSAAGVFYLMLTGRAPFAPGDLPKVLNAVMFHAPAPLTEGEAPDALRRVLTKAQEKDPDRRYRSCSELLADLDQVRRAQIGQQHRAAQAALDRYRRTIALIEERRGLGRALFMADIDRTCDDAIARLAHRFPEFARRGDVASLMEPMDPAVANAALMVLQKLYNTELAAVAALKAEAADSCRRAPDAPLDLTLQRTPTDRSPATGTGEADDAEGRGSLRDRAAALLNRLRTARGQATTEWLMIAGSLAGIAVLLLGSVPRGLAVFVRAMAFGLRTIAP